MALTLYFVDAILIKGVNIDLDAILIQSVFDEFKFSDVHLQDVLHLEPGPFHEFTVDASLLLRPDNNYEVDSLLQEDDKEFEWTVDANAQIMPSNNFSVDAFLQQETDHDFSVDAIIVDRNSLFWDADTILSSRLPLEFTVDPITIGSLDREFDVDSLLQEDGKTTDFTCDAIASRLSASRVDAFIRALDQELDFTVDAIVIVRKTFGFTLDSSIQKDGFKVFNVDAFVLKTQDDDSLVDGQVVTVNGDIDVCSVHFCIPTTPTLFFTVDAITPTKNDLLWNVDAHIELATGLNFLVDAFIATRFDLEWTVDASLIKPSQFNACPSYIRQTLNCSSLIRRRGTS